MNKYTFKLDEEQEEELDVWLAKIKDLHGSCGGLTFIFKPNSIGEVIEVKSSHVENPLDLSHPERW